jgi:hypothetical protein
MAPSRSTTTLPSAPEELSLRRLGGWRTGRGHRLHIDRNPKLNGVDPDAWLADTIARIPDYRITKVDEFLPWHGKR